MRFPPLVALALVLALAACAAPDGDASAPAAGPEGDALSVTVSDFTIDPSELSVTGSTVTFEVLNDGPTPHNLSVRDADGEVVMATADLGTGETETITAELEPGEYTIFCSLGGHESLGMGGTLTVTGG